MKMAPREDSAMLVTCSAFTLRVRRGSARLVEDRFLPWVSKEGSTSLMFGMHCASVMKVY